MQVRQDLLVQFQRRVGLVNKPPQVLGALLPFQGVLAFLGIAARVVRFEVRKPPRTTIACGCTIASLMFVKSFDQVIAMANVEATGARGLQYVDKKSPTLASRA